MVPFILVQKFVSSFSRFKILNIILAQDVDHFTKQLISQYKRALDFKERWNDRKLFVETICDAISSASDNKISLLPTGSFVYQCGLFSSDIDFEVSTSGTSFSLITDFNKALVSTVFEQELSAKNIGLNLILTSRIQQEKVLFVWTSHK